MLFRQIFDDKLAQYAYLIGCQRTRDALLVDPERDVDRYLDLAASEGLRVTAVAETHIHADFLSGARELAELLPEIEVLLSAEGGPDWQSEWAKHGSYRVRFLRDGDTFRVGGIDVRAVHTPGHTPEHLSFEVTDRGGGADEPMGIVTGDFVFVGDLGRPDLLESAAGVAGAMEPSARRLYRSARGFLDLPEHLQVWPAHGAGSACGKALGAVPQSTVGYERRFSPALQAARGAEDDFVRFILAGQPEPPLYFARMKRLNKEGVPLLGALPQPVELDGAALAALAGRKDVTVLDTRIDRDAFIAAHLARSLFAPLDRSFLTVAGSYADPERDLVLVVEGARLEEAVRALVRIGLDHVACFATPETLARVPGLVATECVGFDELALRREGGQATILDVRTASEHAAGHLPGALHLPHTRLALRLGELPRSGEILVHCATGARAASAASLLEREGFRVAYVEGELEG
jgi:hydroxyacylglutathione hydrolase